MGDMHICLICKPKNIVMSAENNEYSFEFERNAMKKLSIMLNNGCQSECWTFYKMAIIETLDQADLWLCSHMNYYVTENHAGRFGDCGEQYGMEYFDSILDFNCIHISEVPPESLIDRIKREIDENKYVIVFFDYGQLYQMEQYIHELMIYGYNERGFICAVLNGGRFVESIIEYNNVEQGYLQAYNFFMSNGWELLWRRAFFFGITSISPRKEYKNDNVLYDFVKKLRAELKGGKIEIETRDFVTAETTTKTCYCGTSALTFLASEFDSDNSSSWKDDKGKRYMTLLALKTAFEHRKQLLRNMRFVQRYVHAESSELMAETINLYSDAITNVERVYLLFYKYCCTRDDEILSSISDLCSNQYNVERPLLQKFEDALWPYYYSLNGVPMPND